MRRAAKSARKRPAGVACGQAAMDGQWRPFRSVPWTAALRPQRWEMTMLKKWSSRTAAALAACAVALAFAGCGTGRQAHEWDRPADGTHRAPQHWAPAEEQPAQPAPQPPVEGFE